MPSAGVEGSTSSQARGFKRLTRRLSFRQRQAQANYQVRIQYRLCDKNLIDWFLMAGFLIGERVFLH